MKSFLQAKIVKNEKFSENIFEMILHVPDIASEAAAGQFVNLYSNQDSMLLPRPISICEIDRAAGNLRLLYQVVGKGTKEFSKLDKGSIMSVLGPLGNGFTLLDKKCHMLVGGGIGVPPLLELAKSLQGNLLVFIGARSNPILVHEFQALGAEVHTASDDGSYGFHGNVMQLIREINPSTEAVYSCGPKIMLSSVAAWAREKGINSQVSMEERMACGIGACVGCTVKIQKEGEADWQHLKVCKDGPVFWGNEVVWDERI